uniref:Uncharacterized protein n=1 Tax=Mycena chlorophos TaxID=658473 RepID=A0ABQ0LJM6_MYCCL|nr:predicted protein [Mycena chlorophos]
MGQLEAFDDERNKEILLSLAILCEDVICCRVSPLQNVIGSGRYGHLRRGRPPSGQFFGLCYRLVPVLEAFNARPWPLVVRPQRQHDPQFLLQEHLPPMCSNTHTCYGGAPSGPSRRSSPCASSSASPTRSWRCPSCIVMNAKDDVRLQIVLGIHARRSPSICYHLLRCSLHIRYDHCCTDGYSTYQYEFATTMSMAMSPILCANLINGLVTNF